MINVFDLIFKFSKCRVNPTILLEGVEFAFQTSGKGIIKPSIKIVLKVYDYDG